MSQKLLLYWNPVRFLSQSARKPSRYQKPQIASQYFGQRYAGKARLFRKLNRQDFRRLANSIGRPSILQKLRSYEWTERIIPSTQWPVPFHAHQLAASHNYIQARHRSWENATTSLALHLIPIHSSLGLQKTSKSGDWMGIADSESHFIPISRSFDLQHTSKSGETMQQHNPKTVQNLIH